MNIEFDPNKALSNIQKHGISFEEAQTVFYDSMALSQEDYHADSENRWILIGLSKQIRLLTVIYSLPNESTIRIISARKSTKKEATYYA